MKNDNGTNGSDDLSEDDLLAGLFADAKAHAAAPSADLQNRVLADADEVQRRLASTKTPSDPTRADNSIIASFLSIIGLRGSAVLAASTILGLSVGYTGASSLSDLGVMEILTSATTATSTDGVDDAFDLLILEDLS